MQTSAIVPPCEVFVTDEQVRNRIAAWWASLGSEVEKAHCGGKGLTVGCPTCGKRWAHDC